MWFLISLKVTKSNTNPDDLGAFANQLTNEFGNLANEAKYAAMTAENNEVNKTKQYSRYCLLRDTSDHASSFIALILLIFFGFQIGSHIKKQVGELGFSCTGLVTKAGALQCSPNDMFTKKELIESARKVSEKVRPKLLTLFFLINSFDISSL